MGYTKLFADIVMSTIWQESQETRILWITMLAIKDERGMVMASVPGLAASARITLQECESGLKKLMSPDKYSRSQEHEGRRIEPIDGGWRVLNHYKYRDKDRDRKEYQKEYYQQRKAKLVNLNNSQPDSTDAPTDTDTDTDTDTNTRKEEHKCSSKRKNFQKPQPKEIEEYAQSIGFTLDGEYFFDFYEARGWLVGKARAPMRDWKAAVRTWKKSSSSGSPDSAEAARKAKVDALVKEASQYLDPQ